MGCVNEDRTRRRIFFAVMEQKKGVKNKERERKEGKDEGRKKEKRNKGLYKRH